ncbi:MAG: RHS repeat-associated core domain-containing protein, partial [Caulobacteraceae bacterium]
FYPALGRFLQPDPAGIDQGPNLYEYVADDPVDRGDPTGEVCGGPGYGSCSGGDTLEGIEGTSVDSSRIPSGSVPGPQSGSGARTQNSNNGASGNPPRPRPQGAPQIGNRLYNEVGGGRPTAKNGEGSRADLFNGEVAMAHVIVNRERAHQKGGIAVDVVSSPEARETWEFQQAQAAANRAENSPDTTHGAINYFLDYGQPANLLPRWIRRSHAIQSFGPFINVAGSGDVTPGASFYIRIMKPNEP